MNGDRHLSEETYKALLKSPKNHMVDSKDTSDAVRAMEYDENGKLLGPAELIEVKSPVKIVRQAPPPPKGYEDFNPFERILIDGINIVVNRAAEYITDQALTNFDQWRQNRKKKRQTRLAQKKPTYTIKAERLLAEQKTTVIAKTKPPLAQDDSQSVRFNAVYDEYRVNMTSQEARKELIDIFMLSVIVVKKQWRLLHANITDADIDQTKVLELKHAINRLCSPAVLQDINGILAVNPLMLEEWASVSVSEILGREMIEKGVYLPIATNEMQDALVGYLSAPQ